LAQVVAPQTPQSWPGRKCWWASTSWPHLHSVADSSMGVRGVGMLTGRDDHGCTGGSTNAVSRSRDFRAWLCSIAAVPWMKVLGCGPRRVVLLGFANGVLPLHRMA
jgi:hypothetical protein